VPLLRYAINKAYKTLGVLSGSGRFPTFIDVRKRVEGYVSEYGIGQSYDMKNAVGRLINRLVEFEMEGEQINRRIGLPLSFFLDNDVVLNIKGPSDFVARTVAMMILTDMQRYYDKEPLASPTTRTLVDIDEASWLFDVVRDRGDYPSNRIVETWFTTCRETGIGRIILTQQPHKVSSFVTDNCAYFAGFRLAGESVGIAQSLLGLSDAQKDYYYKLPKYGECVMRHPEFGAPFLTEIPGDLSIV
jgi:hypothetical protein